jgi:hypothetical protein
MNEEYKKCLKDSIYFIENYCLINGNPIKLKDYQKSFIKYVNRSNKN